MRRSTEYKWHVSPNKSSPIGDILKEDLSKDEVDEKTCSTVLCRLIEILSRIIKLQNKI